MPMHTHIYIYIYIYRICTSCREREANVYADVHNICLTYTPAYAWCATTSVNACRLFAKKCIWTRVCAPIQLCTSFFAMEAIENLSWVLREHRADCCLLPALPPALLLRCATLVAQEIRPNPRWLMTRSPLQCYTSIIRSSALVQASTSLSIGRTCAWPRRLPVTEMHFCHFSHEFLNND